MDALDPLSQVAGGNAPSPLLLIMGCIGAFFAVTAYAVKEMRLRVKKHKPRFNSYSFLDHRCLADHQ